MPAARAGVTVEGTAEPEVALLLDVDAEYRRRAAAGEDECARLHGVH
jgi:hypothetical protein